MLGEELASELLSSRQLRDLFRVASHLMAEFAFTVAWTSELPAEQVFPRVWGGWVAWYGKREGKKDGERGFGGAASRRMG